MKGRGVKIRVLTVAVACTLAAVTLTGCQTKVGAAAVVDGHKISESDLNSYLTPKAQPIQVSQSGSIAPRTFVLETLVENQLLRALLQRQGQPTDASTLAAAHDKALGGATDADYDQQADAAGLSRKFTPIYVQKLELAYLADGAFKSNTAAESAAAAKVPVTLNPRYGTWDPKNGITDLAKNQLPSFLHFSSNLPGDPPPSQ